MSNVKPMTDEELAELDKSVADDRIPDHGYTTWLTDTEWFSLRERLRQEIEYHALTNSLAKGYLADLDRTLGALALEKQNAEGLRRQCVVMESENRRLVEQLATERATSQGIHSDLLAERIQSEELQNQLAAERERLNLVEEHLKGEQWCTDMTREQLEHRTQQLNKCRETLAKECKESDYLTEQVLSLRDELAAERQGSEGLRRMCAVMESENRRLVNQLATERAKSGRTGGLDT